jgi:hypothetical protein
MTELSRLLRHIFAPLVAWLVANGYLPEYMQGDVTEALVLVAALAIPYGFSWWRDRVRP